MSIQRELYCQGQGCHSKIIELSDFKTTELTGYFFPHTILEIRKLKPRYGEGHDFFANSRTRFSLLPKSTIPGLPQFVTVEMQYLPLYPLPPSFVPNELTATTLIGCINSR